MTLETRVTQALKIQHPVVQAPMAGGPTTPELVAAVSNAGGLGSLGAAYLSPNTLREQVWEIRRRTEAPFNVNLFVPSPFEADPERIERSDKLLEPYREELGIQAPETPSSFEESLDDQLEVVLEESISVFSFTFGVPNEEQLRRLRDAGIITVGTATTVREGLRLEESGVDVIVAQGGKAGAPRYVPGRLQGRPHRDDGHSPADGRCPFGSGDRCKGYHGRPGAGGGHRSRGRSRPDGDRLPRVRGERHPS